MTVEEILIKLDALSEALSREYKTKLQDQYKELLKGADLGVNSAMIVAKHVSKSVQKFQEELDKLLSEYEAEISHTSDEDLNGLSAKAQDEVKNKFGSIFEKAYYKLKELFNIK